MSRALTCKGCSGPITDQYVNANGVYHQACFVCFGCKAAIQKCYVSKGDALYHQQCAERADNECAVREGRVCRTCRKACTVGRIMKIKDDLYHADCFLCDSCKTPIRGKYVPIPIPAIPTPTIPIAGVAGVPGVPAVTGVGSRALHPQCAKRLDEAAAIAQGRVCARCSLPCVSVFLTVDSKCYHSACFLCTACQQPIEGRYTHKGDKAPYHPQCMNYGQSGKSGKSGSKSTIAPVSSGRSSSGGSSGGGGSNGIAQVCRGCAQPCTVGHFKSTPTALYHSSCFKCTACSSLIEDKYAEHGTPPNIYHVPCHRRLFSPRCCLCTSIMDGMYHRYWMRKRGIINIVE
ncbi:hypothetical protein B484DRAFT_291573 [Ochromonadaceae sp. CCMP2298]|nr:hypothetical protein B484DRAFT_291573 [Ochromonadaceae sp. CCMP2298]